MDKQQFIKNLIAQSGVIKTNLTGECICTSCGGTGDKYELSVVHKPTCSVVVGIKLLLTNLPDNPDITPTVESRLSLGAMLPYYAELPATELQEIEQCIEGLSSADIEQRIQYAAKCGKCSPTIDPELLQDIVAEGFKDNEAKLSFKNYCIFCQATSQQLVRLDKELSTLIENKQRLTDIFTAIFTKKYNYRMSND